MMNLWKHLIFVLLCVFSAVSQAAWSVRYQHTDVLGSVIAESNAQGTITQRFGYKPFGEGSPTQKTGVGYTGHLEDTDLGLTYMQQRYYDPVVGRFYSNDPVGFTASNPMMFNRYAYANNNPYKFTDPNGENPAVTWAATRSFRVGYSIGSKINSGITAALGKPLGVAIYNAVNNESATEKPSLVDEKGEKHILDGDGDGKGGGHRNGTGKPGKSEFPSDWSDEKILGEVSDVATDPESTVETQSDGRIISKGTRDGIDIKTVQEPASRGGRIVTGYPTNTPKNPKP